MRSARFVLIGLYNGTDANMRWLSKQAFTTLTTRKKRLSCDATSRV